MVRDGWHTWCPAKEDDDSLPRRRIKTATVSEHQLKNCHPKKTPNIFVTRSTKQTPNLQRADQAKIHNLCIKQDQTGLDMAARCETQHKTNTKLTKDRSSKNPQLVHKDKTLPKAQRTRGLSSSCQSNFLRSYYNFKHKS